MSTMTPPSPTALPRPRREGFPVSWSLLIIVGLYGLLAVLYAVYTPLWQAPDEPAHFNNIRLLATTGRLPVLQPGDYDEAYLNELKAHRFPPEWPIDGLRYEAHQPPLYYLLAVPVWWLGEDLDLRGRVLLLRLQSVVWGAGVVWLIGMAVRHLFPRRPDLAVLTAGFAALLPMHLAMMAAINNDGLSELLIAAVVVRLLMHLRHPEGEPRAWLGTGLLTGLALMTKFQAYILVPLVATVWLWQVVRGTPALRNAMAWLAPMLLVPLPWWLRNGLVYGLNDPLGLQRHEAIVTGQPRTAVWIAQFGPAAYVERLGEFTFKSFWGVFGWLGVFLDGRVYALLGLLSLLVVAGWIGQGVHRHRQAELTAWQRRGLVLLGGQALLVVAGYVWYNLDFVQHQGRYLFPGLLPFSLGFALGWQGLRTTVGSAAGALLAALVAGGLALRGWQTGDVDGRGLLVTTVVALLLWLQSRKPTIPALVWDGSLLMLLVLLALYALFGAIVPQLTAVLSAVGA